MNAKYQKYIATGLTAFCVIAASLLLFFLLYQFKSFYQFAKDIVQILEPFLIGAVVAYLVAPLYNLLTRNISYTLSKKLKPRHANMIAVAFSLFVSIMVALLAIVALVALIVPQFIKSIIGIYDSLEMYSNNFILWLNNVLSDRPELAHQIEDLYQQFSASLFNWVNTNLAPNVEALLNSISSISTIFSGLISGVKVLVRLVKDFIIGFIASAYLLASKRHLIALGKKIVYGIFPLKTSNFILYQCRYIHTVFGGFIRGKLLDSLIIGILCFIGCSIFQFPYPLVVSVIVGVTNIIPFFGPFVGAIPSALLILMVSPIKCLYFIIFILALQQFDGNVLGPKILGDTTGLSSFWVLFSIILFGGLFGFVGMIIAVPLFAVIYSLISSYISHRLSKKQLPLETEHYELLDRVEDSGKVFVHMKDPTVK